MLPAKAIRLDRIRACVCDLSENGINLEHADDGGLNRMVREHIDYFQLMLGYDSDPGEVLELIKSQAAH